MIVLCAQCRLMYRQDASTVWTEVGNAPIPPENELSHGMCPGCAQKFYKEEIEPRQRKIADAIAADLVPVPKEGTWSTDITERFATLCATTAREVALQALVAGETPATARLAAHRALLDLDRRLTA